MKNKTILILIFILSFNFYAYSSDLFKHTQMYGKRMDNITEVEKYVKFKLDALFPNDTIYYTDNIKIYNKSIYIVTAYYEELKNTSVGDNLYFISFWEQTDDKDILCIGSNILKIHSPILNTVNDLITLTAKKGYDFFNTYFYTFKYKNSKIYIHRVMSMKNTPDNSSSVKYYYKSGTNSPDIRYHSADSYIK